MATQSGTQATIDGARSTGQSGLPAPGEWQIDPSHSSVEFVVRHLVVGKSRGRFADFSGKIQVAEVPEQSSVEVVIQAASIDTRDERRDGHLRSADFFEVDSYPTIEFRSTAVEPHGDTWKVTGDLTIKGRPRPVVLDVELGGLVTDPWGNSRAAFSASTEVDREDWGLTWNQALEGGGLLVGKKARIELEIEAVAAPAS